MEFTLTDEQRMVREMAAEFADGALAPGAAERDRAGRFPDDAVKRAGELGLCGMLIPEEWDGAGLGHLSAALVLMEIARVCPSTAVTLSVTNSVAAYPIWRFGTDAQREKYLRPLAAGKYIGGFCLTEPQAGSDASNQKTRAIRRKDRYILNGTKVWVTNAHVGKVFVVMAVTDPRKKRGGVSAFILTPDMPGFSFGPKEQKMGLRASATASVILTDCEVPAENLLGEEGDGMHIPFHSLDGGRIGIAAQSVGIARGAMDLACAYARERHAFGKPIAKHQAIAFQLADMDTEIDAGRLLTLAAAARRDGKLPGAGRAASAAKLFASEMCNRVAYRAVQIHGGYGFSSDYAVERFYRDARVTTLYEGTSEVQRMVISRSLLADGNDVRVS
ncbi:MAG: acyl-CoA dehydrogenase family protein [Acidobacteriota bacterium]